LNSITKFLKQAILAALFLLPSLAFAYVSPGNPTGFVNDFAGVFSVEQKQNLETELDAFKKETTTEIAVVTIKSLDGDDIESFANTLFREWGIGEKDKNNGVLFLIAIEDRKMRVEIGYGLEGALTDVESFRIQEDLVKPLFREENYRQGIVLGTQAIKEAVRGEYTAPVGSVNGTSESTATTIVFAILIGGIIFFQTMFAILAPTKSWWLGGVLGLGVGSVIGYLAFSFFVGLVTAGALAIFGLLFDFIVSQTYTGIGKSRRDFWTSGGFGGWGSGGSSGGGFGGFGGGSSGGGGSSSSW